MPDQPIATEALTEDVDLSMECAGVCIGSAVAMDAGGDPVRVLQQAIEIWPANVSDHALVIGQRVTFALLYQLNLDPNEVAEVAMTLGRQADEHGGADDNGQ